MNEASEREGGVWEQWLSKDLFWRILGLRVGRDSPLPQVSPKSLSLMVQAKAGTHGCPFCTQNLARVQWGPRLP